jgi:hypothetical protein
MHRLQSYGRPESIYDQNSYTITSTFDGHNLSMYASHLTAYRNARDWTSEKRNEFIAAANQRAGAI